MSHPSGYNAPVRAALVAVSGAMAVGQAASKAKLPSITTPAKRRQAKRYAAAQAKVAGQQPPAGFFTLLNQ